MPNPVNTATEVGKGLKEKYGEWKSKLSASFSHDQIFFSLLVLGIFYVVYTIVNAYFDINAKNEDDIFEQCYCKFSHRFFYRFWFGFCSVLWLIIHIYIYLTVRFPVLANPLKLLALLRDPKDVLDQVKRFITTCCRRRKRNQNTPTTGDSSSKSSNKSDEDIKLVKRNIKILWFQYYKLYVVGYAKENEEVSFDKKDSNKITKKDDDCKKKERVSCYCCSAYYMKRDDEDDNELEECSNCNFELENGVCENVLVFITRSILLCIKFVAQLATVPLLLLQMFDTYSLLCFNPGDYCSNDSKYRLHLVQTAITLSFYCSLALSQLASTLLAWNPWLKKENESKQSDCTVNTAK